MARNYSFLEIKIKEENKLEKELLMFKKQNVKFAGIVFLAVFMLALSWSSALAETATKETDSQMLSCVEAYSNGPDFIYNPYLNNLKVGTNGSDCLTERTTENSASFIYNAYLSRTKPASIDQRSVENAANFIFNAYSTRTEPAKFQESCLDDQTYYGPPSFIFNAQSMTNLSIAEMNDRCSPS